MTAADSRRLEAVVRPGVPGHDQGVVTQPDAASEKKPETPPHTGIHALLSGLKEDVVFGAAIGSIAGRTVTEHGRNVWAFAPAAVPGGVAVFATRNVR